MSPWLSAWSTADLPTVAMWGVSQHMQDLSLSLAVKSALQIRNIFKFKKKCKRILHALPWERFILFGNSGFIAYFSAYSLEKNV